MFKILELLASILLAPILLWNIIQRQYWLRTKGFWANIKYRYGIKYQEMQNGRIEQLIIPGNIQFGESAEIYLPSSKEWQETMPEWAKRRKDELLERVKIFCLKIGLKLSGLYVENSNISHDKNNSKFLPAYRACNSL